MAKNGASELPRAVARAKMIFPGSRTGVPMQDALRPNGVPPLSPSKLMSPLDQVYEMACAKAGAMETRESHRPIWIKLAKAIRSVKRMQAAAETLRRAREKSSLLGGQR